jgi:hypothetical protein
MSLLVMTTLYSIAFAQFEEPNGAFSILGIFFMVDSKVSDLVQFKHACFFVSSSSCEPNGVWFLNDYYRCIFALPAINNIVITNYASYFHRFDARNRLRLLWNVVYRHTGREWLYLALILGDSMFGAFLIYMLDIRFVHNSSWTNHNTADNEKEYNSSVLDSPGSVLRCFACGSTTVLWSNAFC